MKKINDMKILMAGVLLFAAALLSCSSDKDGSQAQAGGDGSQVSTTEDASGTAPLFTAQDVSGQWHSADEWLGKQPVVINFWGTWCPPCRREIPDLVKLNDEYGPKGVVLVSLAVNDTPSKVKEYGENNYMDWTLLMAEDQMLVDYKVTTGIPTTIFIDKNGNEVTRFIGMRDYSTLKQGFDAIL